MRRDAPELFEVSPRPDARGGPSTTRLPAPPELVCAALEPMLTAERKRRIASVIDTRSRAFAPVLDGLIDPHNVAAVLRSAEAFGVQEVHLLGGEEFLASQRIAQGTQRWVDVTRHRSAEACAEALHARGYRVYVAAVDGELAPEALAGLDRVAVVFGNEHAGVSPEMRRLADGTYTIPMRGFVQSLNVSVAAALTMFAATRGRAGDLEPAERLALRARYYMLSVPQASEIVTEQLRRNR